MKNHLFDADQNWLAQQPGMKPWTANHKRLGTQLERWLCEYSAALCERVVTADHSGRDGYLNRLWGCWSYHWREAGEANGGRGADGWEVAERLRNGLDARGRGSLGGDPLRDVVLAEALLQRDNAATLNFEREYRVFAGSVIRRVRPSFPAECPDWWSDFADRLAGYTHPTGKLARFSGRCGLRPWLATVLRRFVYDHSKPGRPGQWELLANGEEGDRAGELAPEEGLITAECIGVFVQMIRDALTTLPPADRLLLRLSFVDGLSGRQAAQMAGVDPGTISRRKARALEILARTLDVPPDGAVGRGPKHDCLRHLLGGQQRLTFGSALLDALQEFARAGERS